MSIALRRTNTNKALYMIGFFFGLGAAIPAYINSEFLAQWTGPVIVGIIFTISNLVTLIAFGFVGRLLKKYGDYAIASFLSSLAILSLIGLIVANNPFLVVPFYVIFSVSTYLLYFSLDIFLVTDLVESRTGTVRGTFMSIYNTAWILAPIIAGFILSRADYNLIYLAALIALLPVVSLLGSNFNHFKDSDYHNISWKKILTALPKHKSTYKIMGSNFLLHFFYTWMVIYTPIYLHTYMGFEWSQIGIMFTIMLLPFAILEAPLGRLADERWGEKEMLSAGFIITALATILLSFIPSADFWLWTAGLLATRIGASTIEIMNETYFFKKNRENHPDIVGLFRMTAPTAAIIASLAATIILQFVDYQSLFFILGCIMLWGLRYSLTLKDTL